MDDRSVSKKLVASQLDGDDVVRRRTDLSFSDIGGGRVVLGPSGEPVTLNESASVIYRAIDGRRTISDLAGPVAEWFAVPPAEVEQVLVSTIRRFATKGLLENVVFEPGVPDPNGVEQFPDVAETQRVPEAASRRGLSNLNSCVAERFHLDDAEFFDIRTPAFSLCVGASGPEMINLVNELLGQFVVQEEMPVGLMLVAPATRLQSARTVATIFDGSGYRAWRSREMTEVGPYLLSLLSPLGATSTRQRCFVDYRAIQKRGKTILVHPYVLDDVRVMLECERRGWTIVPRLYTELDCETGNAIFRAAFDPLQPQRTGGVVRESSVLVTMMVLVRMM